MVKKYQNTVPDPPTGYLTGEIPLSFCNIYSNLNDFDISNNQLCPPYPDCIENEDMGNQYTNVSGFGWSLTYDMCNGSDEDWTVIPPDIDDDGECGEFSYRDCNGGCTASDLLGNGFCNQVYTDYSTYSFRSLSCDGFVNIKNTCRRFVIKIRFF